MHHQHEDLPGRDSLDLLVIPVEDLDGVALALGTENDEGRRAGKAIASCPSLSHTLIDA